MSEPNITASTSDKPAVAVAAAPAPPAAPAAPKPAAKLPAKKGDDRRGFIGGLFNWWIIGWATFTAAMTAFTLGTVRFMVPNVLFEASPKFKAGYADTYE